MLHRLTQRLSGNGLAVQMVGHCDRFGAAAIGRFFLFPFGGPWLIGSPYMRVGPLKARIIPVFSGGALGYSCSEMKQTLGYLSPWQTLPSPKSAPVSPKPAMT
jgi:hypothetical protein